VATLAALVTLVSIPVVMGTAHPADIPAFAVPTVIATVFGALEDHARRLLHLAGRSREAVISAFVMLFVSVVAVVGLAALPMVRAWVPITALAIANISSLATSAFLVRGAEPVDRAMTAIRALAPVGRFLLFTGVVPAAAYFVATAMVNRLAGPDQLGYSEAARVVSQPILVLGVGLLRVLGPRAMEAGRDLDRARGRRVARTFNAVMIGGSAAFAAAVAVPWALNPFGYLVPTAYVVPWLVVVSVIANAVIGVGFAARSEMLGGGRAKNVARGEIGTTVVGLVFAATAAWTQAFARPLSRFGSAVYRSAYYQLDAARMYSETTPTDAAT
jgi:O-antigen/teichoic acid export membrane protein